VDQHAPLLFGDLSRPSTIEFDVGTVTPTQAAAWLSTADRLHRAHTRAVESYAREMERGSWKLNGEPIIFSDQHVLLDGHARLRACVKANKAFVTLIIRGINRDTFDTIDAVRKRTLGDILHIRREPHGRQLASSLMIIWRHWNGDLLDQSKLPSTGDLLAILAAYPEIRSISVPAAEDAAPSLPLGIGIAMHHLFARVNIERANELFQQFVDRAQGTSGGILRGVLDDMINEGGRRVQQTVIALTIKAWNAFIDGRQVSTLRFLREREQFPKISGMEAFVLTSADEADAHDSVENAATNDRLFVEVSTITPELAAELLTNNPGNRLVADGVVAKYRRDMSAGRWLLNGQTIKIGKTGRLLDGQHRLHACVQSSASFPAIVVRGVDEDVFDTFDLGGRRSYANVLQERGEKNTAALAASLRWVWTFEEGKIFDRVTVPTNSELDATLAKHEGIIGSLRYANQIKHVIAPGLGIALHYLWSQKSPEEANEFMDRIADGQSLTKGMPAYHLRERLISDKNARKVRMAESERFVLAIKAWNAFRQKKRVVQLSWRGKGPAREALPEIL
jgi:hypothetical protein